MSEPTIIPGCSVLPPLTPKVPRGQGQHKGKSAMPSGRFHTLNAFVDASLCGVNGTAAKVWLILFRDTKPNGLACVGNADLARRAGVSVRAVGSAKRILVVFGLIQIVKKGSLVSGASVYRVRALVEEANCRRVQEVCFQNLGKPSSSFPERDQKGCPTLSGSATSKKKSPRRRQGGTP